MDFISDFSHDEFDRRIEQAQILMKRDRLDALFITTEPDIRYFTGFRTLFWQSPTRPWFLIIPANSQPITVIPEIGAYLMKQSFHGKTLTWPAPQIHDDGISILIDQLKKFTKIGMLMGHETHLHMPLQNFMTLQKSLKADWQDATKLVQSIRMIKSDAEIEIMRKIANIASDCFDEIPKKHIEGNSLKSIFRDFKMSLLAHDADDVPYLVGGAGNPSYHDVISPPNDRPLVKGDVFMMDTGAIKSGYYCDFDRNYAIGEAHDAMKQAHEDIYEATELALNSARPGVKASEVFAVMAKYLQDNSTNYANKGGAIGRFGHGLGIELTESPSLASFDDTVLKENMVITIEPSLTLNINGNASTMLVSEENIVIRDGAPELLSKRTNKELVII